MEPEETDARTNISETNTANGVGTVSFEDGHIRMQYSYSNIATTANYGETGEEEKEEEKEAEVEPGEDDTTSAAVGRRGGEGDMEMSAQASLQMTEMASGY